MQFKVAKVLYKILEFFYNFISHTKSHVLLRSRNHVLLSIAACLFILRALRVNFISYVRVSSKLLNKASIDINENKEICWHRYSNNKRDTHDSKA